MNDILQEKLKEYESLKILSEKYIDLELTKYGKLINFTNNKRLNQ